MATEADPDGLQHDRLSKLHLWMGPRSQVPVESYYYFYVHYCNLKTFPIKKGFIISSPTQMPIRTMCHAECSSLTWAGWWSRSIRMWRLRDRPLIWAIWTVIRLWCFRRSEKTKFYLDIYIFIIIFALGIMCYWCHCWASVFPHSCRGIWLERPWLIAGMWAVCYGIRFHCIQRGWWTVLHIFGAPNHTTSTIPLKKIIHTICNYIFLAQ